MIACVKNQIVLLWTALIFILLIVPTVWTIPLPPENRSKPSSHKRKLSDASADGAEASPKVHKGTRTFENETQMRKNYQEMGRKGGKATSKAYLDKAKGDQRLATKLRSKAAKDSIEDRTKRYGQEVKQARIQESNRAIMDRFKASEQIALAKGLPPAGNQRRQEVGGVIDVGA